MQRNGTVVLIHIITLILGTLMAFEYTIAVGVLTSMVLALLTGMATNLLGIYILLKQKK